MKKKTTEEFILQAEGAHGNAYDYSCTFYTGAKNKVLVKCKDHGEFKTCPQRHITGSGLCPKCLKLRSKEFFLDN